MNTGLDRFTAPAMARASLLAILAATLATSTAWTQPIRPQTRGKPARSIASGTWTQLWQLGVDTELLYKPELLAVRGGRVVVFDYGDHSLKSIRLGGKLEWRFGRKGNGPGEFINPTMIALDSVGQTIVLDPDQRRVTTISAVGKLVRGIPLTKGYERLASDAGNANVLLVSTRNDTMFTVVDQKGLSRATALAPSVVADVLPLAREVLGVVPTRNGYLLSFRWSSTFLEVNKSGALVRTCQGVDSLGFPATRARTVTIGGQEMRVRRVDPKGTEAGYAMTTLGGKTAVLAPAASADDPRILDLYEPACGRYRESRLFPFESWIVGGQGDSLVAVVSEPVPHLALFRWMPRK